MRHDKENETTADGQRRRCHDVSIGDDSTRRICFTKFIMWSMQGTNIIAARFSGTQKFLNTYTKIIVTHFSGTRFLFFSLI